MKSTLKIEDPETQEEIEVAFHYDVLGEPQLGNYPGFSDMIDDLWWSEELYSREFNDGIWSELQSIEARLLVDAGKQKEEALYESKTGGLD